MRKNIARALRRTADKIHPQSAWRVMPVSMKKVTPADLERIFGRMPKGGAR